VERIFATELGLHDEPERVEEATADAEHRAQGVLGGGVTVPVPLVVVQLGDEVDLGVPRGDIRPLVAGEEHHSGDAEQRPGHLGLARRDADPQLLVTEGYGKDERHRRYEVGGRRGECGGRELGPCLVHPKTKKFSRFSVASNFAAHT